MPIEKFYRYRMAACLAAITVLSLTGCARITKTYLPADVFTPGDTSQGYITADETIDVSKLPDAWDAATDTVIVKERNEVIARAIGLSDRKCTWHKADVMARANSWNIGMGSTSILLASAASVVDHAGTAADLAAGAAATSGIQALANKEIYQNALITTILRSIDVARAKRRAAIDKGMLDDEYTLEMALIDIQAYHDTCSLMAGLVEITKALDNRKPSQNELEANIAYIKTELEDFNTNFASLDTEQQTATKNALSERLAEMMLQRAALTEKD